MFPGLADTPPRDLKPRFDLLACFPESRPALLAEDSIGVRQGLVQAQVAFLHISGDHHRETEKQGCHGQPHCPVRGHLERKELSELGGLSAGGALLTLHVPTPGAHLEEQRPLVSRRRRAGSCLGSSGQSATRTRIPWEDLGLLQTGLSLQSWLGPRPCWSRALLATNLGAGAEGLT